MCVVMVTDKSTVSAGFKANYQVNDIAFTCAIDFRAKNNVLFRL